MDPNKIQWALKYGNETQRKQLAELFSQVNSVMDEIPNSNELDSIQQIYNHGQQHSLATLTTMPIESAQTIEQTNPNNNDKDVTIQNPKASQLPGRVSVYDLNTCPTKLTINQQHRMETDLAYTSRVSDMSWNNLYKTIGNNNHNFENHMSVRGDIGNLYSIGSVLDYNSNELDSIQQIYNHGQQHSLATLTTMPIESAQTIEQTNANNNDKDVTIQNPKASQLPGRVSVYDLNTCPTKLTINQQQRMETDLAYTSRVSDMSWNNLYKTSGNNNHNFENHMSVSGDIGNLYSIGSVLDYNSNELDSIQQIYNHGQQHSLATLTTMPIESAQTIEQTNANNNDKDVTIQNPKASQLPGRVSVYDLNTCPTKLTINQQQRMETDLAYTSRVSDMSWNNLYKTSGNNNHNFENHMSVSGDIGNLYSIGSVLDYNSNELDSLQQIYNHGQQHSLATLTTMPIESAQTIEQTNANNNDKDVTIQNPKASQLPGRVSVYDLNTCPTKLTINQQQRMETDLAYTSRVSDMSWNDLYKTSGNNNHNFENHMSVSGDIGNLYSIGSVLDYGVNEINWMQQPQQNGLATLTTMSIESAKTIGKLNRNNKYQDDPALDQRVSQKLRKTEDCYPTTPTILQQQPMDVDLPWKDFYNVNGNSSNHTFVAHNEASVINYLYYLSERPESPIPVFNVVSEKSALDEYHINDESPLYNATATLATVSELNSMEQNGHTCPQNELRSLDDPVSKSTTTTINHQKIMETASGNDNNTSNTPVSNDSDLENAQVKSSINGGEGNEMVDDVESLNTVTLTRICQSINYHDQNDYLYTKTIPKRTLNNSYYRCKNYVRHGCPARVVAENNDISNAILRKGHNHLPEKKDVCNEKFDKTLDGIMKDNEFERPLKLYLKAKKKLCNEMDTANIPTPKSKESFVRRRKNQTVPKLPKTIEEFINIMSDDKYKFYSKTERNATFYRGVWEVNGNSNIVFISQETLDLLNTMDNVILLMDGTFKVLPRHFRRRFRQLYVINFIYKGRCYPLAYILMQTKNFEAYDLIFNRLKLMIPSVRISGCMTDYETATRKALSKHFPEAILSACFFHYVQAIHKAFKRYGMLTEDKFQNALQEVSTLALLPNEDVLPGFEIISKKMDELASERWEKFSSYWKKNWPAANISVYELTDRTNNFSESLNNVTNSMNGPKPDIWKFISNLKLVETHKSDELKNHVGSLMYTTRRSQEITRLNDTINKATDIYKKNKNIEEFLANITFSKRLESFFKERIFIVGVDKDDFDDDFDDFEDVIIPNSFNVELNFDRQPLKRKIANQGGSNKKRQVTLVSYDF